MTPPLSSAPSVGRLTGFVLGFVVFVCVALIGCAGYLKYQLDRAETVLAATAPELSSDAEITDKLRRSLGYGGFLGEAQSYITAHDPALVANMRSEIKTADDLINDLPEKTPAEIRHDLQSIVSMFDTVMQKIVRSTSDPATTVTANDLYPLYASLPVLDSRLASAAISNKTEAHSRLQFWAMLLTLISWCSLIIAAAMAVGIYLSLRDRNSAPLRALAQSIRNMASGDMRTSIWGMERSDMVGELARAVDMARYNFSQLPDIAVLSDQGPLRLRFEGKTRSMFDAMMQVISRDSEQVRGQATSLTEAVTRQEEAITLISSRVEAVLHNVEKRGLDGDHQIKQIVNTLLGSAQSLKNAQEHSTDQLNRLIPYLQERAQGMAEIAQITGKQIAQVLQNLTLTERDIKISAEQSDAAIKKFSSTADDLGGRLFGAVNLLQASGKVLSETTEKTQSRLNEAIAKLQENVTASSPQLPVEDDLTSELVARLQEMISAFDGTQAKLEERILQQTQAAQAQIDLLSTQSSSLLQQTTTTAQTLSTAADNLRSEHSRFDEIIGRIAAKIEDLSTRLENSSASPDSSINNYQSLETPDAMRAITSQMDSITQQLATLNSGLSSSSQPDVADDLHQKIDNMSQRLISEIADGLNQFIHPLSNMQGQLTSFMDRLISIPSESPSAELGQRLDTTISMIEEMRHEMAGISRPTIGSEAEQSHNLAKDVQERWFQLAAQIEATRSDLMQAIIQQVDRVEVRMNGHALPTGDTPIPALDTQKQIEQQTMILTELVATLGVLDAHMQQLKTEVRAVRH